MARKLRNFVYFSVERYDGGGVNECVFSCKIGCYGWQHDGAKCQNIYFSAKKEEKATKNDSIDIVDLTRYLIKCLGPPCRTHGWYFGMIYVVPN